MSRAQLLEEIKKLEDQESQLMIQWSEATDPLIIELLSATLELTRAGIKLSKVGLKIEDANRF